MSEFKYQKLLREQLEWLNENYYQVRNKSLLNYIIYITMENYPKI